MTTETEDKIIHEPRITVDHKFDRHGHPCGVFHLFDRVAKAKEAK